MKTLELKHLSPYLPYGLNIQYLGTETVELVGFNKNTIYHTTGFFVELPCNIKPILRPLSDLTKEQKDEIHSILPNVPNWECFKEEWVKEKWDLSETIIEYAVMCKLFEWHFDVFGLIDQGLAINLNSINQ